MLKAYLKKEYLPQNGKKTILKICFALIYFLALVDFVPDFIPMLGYLDDITVVAWVYRSITDEIDAFKAFEENQK